MPKKQAAQLHPKRRRSIKAVAAGVGGVYPVRRPKHEPVIEIGDLRVVDRDRLGFDVEDFKGRRLCWFNAAGAKFLRKWLNQHGAAHEGKPTLCTEAHRRLP